MLWKPSHLSNVGPFSLSPPPERVHDHNLFFRNGSADSFDEVVKGSESEAIEGLSREQVTVNTLTNSSAVCLQGSVIKSLTRFHGALVCNMALFGNSFCPKLDEHLHERN